MENRAAEDVRAGYRARVKRERVKAPRLAAIAAWINGLANGHTATIERGYCNTDRHPKGVRWRIPGKGREGNRLIVKDQSGENVIDHNAAETYRTNAEALEKAERLFGKMPVAQKEG